MSCAVVVRGDALSLDDIQYWIGTGDNRAALVIDWADDAAIPPALVWGYRWDGAATGADMLRDVVTADDRLFAKFGGSFANPVSVYGLGYDANDDGAFALDDSTTFSSVGIAITEPADAATSINSGDHYAEGWYLGFWHYGNASSNPYNGGAWADAPKGMAGRNLVNGAWDSWTYSPTFNFASFATNPQAVPSPFPPGDYNRDTVVTMADFTKWKELYGSDDAAADGNGNGIVDAADYTVWRNNLGMGSSAAFQPAAEVPEPNTSLFAIAAVLFHVLAAQRRNRLAVGASPRKNSNIIPLASQRRHRFCVAAARLETQIELRSVDSRPRLSSVAAMRLATTHRLYLSRSLNELVVSTLEETFL